MANTKAVNFAEIKANEGVPYAKPDKFLITTEMLLTKN